MIDLPIQIGMNGRFFPANWRSARDEIVFASLTGFRCLQFPGPGEGLGVQRLGDSLETVALALRRARMTAVMEMVVPLYANGRTESGQTPLDVLHANLQAITTLACTCVHWHIVLREPLDQAQIIALEESLLAQLAAAAALGRRVGFRFGLEHNSADVPVFHRPERCQKVLTAVPHLGFVWDFNHTHPDDFAAYAALVSRASLLHISDTAWPEVNHHLPLGLGSLDLTVFMRAALAGGYRGPAILEIGGLPKSGGYGRDTDEALVASRLALTAAVQAALADE
ncbi:MAG: sugar phosphate isomerase/epimerase [Chloroflexi bacterium]|nr:sugar phosphate isomerase/epimerase [Chloroflexota bacterium]